MYAGLEKSSGDYIAVMDVDLQDPPELLVQMFQDLEAVNMTVLLRVEYLEKGNLLSVHFLLNYFIL